MESDAKIFRKLGAAEVVYDYELTLKGCILPVSLIFDTKHDLFELKERIFEKAIYHWKRYHPFLCSKILVCKDLNNNETSDGTFSQERFFALANEDKINNFDNIDYYRLDSTGGKIDPKIWMLLHERELNIEPFDTENGLLWRLLLVHMSHDSEYQMNQYCLIFTIHHAIVDARNCFALLNHLLTIMNELLLEKFNENYEPFEVSPSIEQKLFGDDPSKLNQIKLNEKYEISPENKIPSSFAFTDPTSQTVSFVNFESGDKFTKLFDKSRKYKDLLVKDLVDDRNENKLISKFIAFTIEKTRLEKLLKFCKLNECKLTGCLNTVSCLATYELYKKNVDIDPKLTQQICFHMLANLRQFLDLGNLNMGYWAIVLNGLLNTNEIDLNGNEFYSKKFWSIAKDQSDSIHERIRQNELVENAKLDVYLLNLINQNFVFENGSVHFAISNLGALKQTDDSSQFKMRELYFNTSCVANRWTGVVFHGLSTLNDNLCWSLGYNSTLVNDQCIKLLVQSINVIIDKITSND